MFLLEIFVLSARSDLSNFTALFATSTSSNPPATAAISKTCIKDTYVVAFAYVYVNGSNASSYYYALSVNGTNIWTKQGTQSGATCYDSYATEIKAGDAIVLTGVCGRWAAAIISGGIILDPSCFS